MASERHLQRPATLGVLLAVLAAVLWWQFAAQPDVTAPAGGTAVEDQPGSSLARNVTKSVPTVALSRLGREAVEPNDTGRDPFRFSTPSPAGRSAAGRGGLPQGQASLPTPPPAIAAPAGPPPLPPIPLKFIGLVVSKRAGTRIAMVTDGRGVYSGVEGAVIEGRYRIVRIGTDSIDVAYLDGRGRRTIPLSGT